MAISKKHMQKVDASNLNDWLSSLGFLYPITDEQLDRFDKYFEDYEFKLKDATIDSLAIINNNYRNKAKVVNLKSIIPDDEIRELKMVARKGNDNLPKHIIEKMLKKHTKEKDNEQ